jgi:hypothetical protein
MEARSPPRRISRSRLASLSPQVDAEKVEANRLPILEVALDLGVRDRNSPFTPVALAAVPTPVPCPRALVPV